MIINDNLQNEKIEIVLDEPKSENLEEENKDNSKYCFSINKVFSWLSIYLSFVIPAIGFALAAISLTRCNEEEKEYVSKICFISMGIAIFNFIIALMEQVI